MLGLAMQAVTGSVPQAQQAQAKPSDGEDSEQHMFMQLQSASSSHQIPSTLPLDKQLLLYVETQPVSGQPRQEQANDSATLFEGSGLASQHVLDECSTQSQTMLEMPDMVEELLANLASSPSQTEHPRNGNTWPHKQPSTSPTAVSDADCMPGNSTSALLSGSSSASRPLQPLCSTVSTSKHSFMSHNSRPFSAGAAHRSVPDFPSRLCASGSAASGASVDTQTCSNHVGISSVDGTGLSLPLHTADSTAQAQSQSICNVFSSEGLARQQMWLVRQQQQAELSAVEGKHQQADCSCSDSEGSISSENNLRPSSASRCRHGCLQHCKVSYCNVFYVYHGCITTICKPLTVLKSD